MVRFRSSLAWPVHLERLAWLRFDLQVAVEVPSQAMWRCCQAQPAEAQVAFISDRELPNEEALGWCPSLLALWQAAAAVPVGACSLLQGARSRRLRALDTFS